MRKITALSAAFAGWWLWKRRSRNSGAGPESAPPGEENKAGSRTLEAGASLLQGKSPLQSINMYLDGFHFFSDDMGRQMEAHHFCSRLNEDFIQCVIYDGNAPGSRLIGVEYIVSERLFKTLPEEERRLWHSHQYEVKSGELHAAGLSAAAEHELMSRIVNTYGKIWHTWDTQQYDLPVGIPALMMGFTEDGQINPALLEERDRRLGISTDRLRESRRDIPAGEAVFGANAWESGSTVQLSLQQLPVKMRSRAMVGDPV